MEKYHFSSVIQDFVFLSRKKGCIMCISLQVYNKMYYFFRVFTVCLDITNLQINKYNISLEIINRPGDKNISILYLSCRTSDLQFSLVLQIHALVL